MARQSDRLLRHNAVKVPGSAQQAFKPVLNQRPTSMIAPLRTANLLLQHTTYPHHHPLPDNSPFGVVASYTHFNASGIYTPCTRNTPHRQREARCLLARDPAAHGASTVTALFAERQYHLARRGVATLASPP